MATEVDRISNVLKKEIRMLRMENPSLRSASYLKVAVWSGDSRLADFLLHQEPNFEWGTSLMERNSFLIALKKTIKTAPKTAHDLSMFITKLIDNHALDVEMGQENGSGHTALDRAILYNDQVTAKLLLAEGANVNYLQTIGGYSPLMDAISDRSRDRYDDSMAFLLIKYGADITYKTSDGTTVLDACTHAARVDMMNVIIDEHPTDIDAFEQALRIACIQSRVRPSEIHKIIPQHESPTVEPLLLAIENGILLILHRVSKRFG